tara:strand:- start:3200 stop:4456 length:1257 start_codon:yes stop_codon:yes gene_type:complete
MYIGKRIKKNVIKQGKLLIVNLHFWPDKSSCSAILFHIAKELSKDISPVEIITSKPKKFNSNFTNLELKKYDRESDLKIHRLPLLRENLSAYPRIFNALMLGFYTAFKLLTSNYKIVIATSSPPILTAFIISLIAKLRKIRFIYYCMDINPEIGILTGDFKNNFLSKLMLSLDKFSCINASPTIVHSISMKETLLRRFNNRKIQIKIINSLTVPIKSINKNKTKVLNTISFNSQSINNGLQIIFAGNIGRFQGIENIIHAFKYLIEYDDIRLIILGDGFEKNKLKKLSKSLGTNVEFLDMTSYDQAKDIISRADLGLVSLKPNMYKFAYPSKTMTYLEQGIPILAMIEKESDLALDIVNENIGFVVPLKEHRELANLLIKLNKNHDWKEKLKKSSLKAFEKKFSDKVILNKWGKLIFQ